MFSLLGKEYGNWLFTGLIKTYQAIGKFFITKKTLKIPTILFIISIIYLAIYITSNIFGKHQFADYIKAILHISCKTGIENNVLTGCLSGQRGRFSSIFEVPFNV